MPGWDYVDRLSAQKPAGSTGVQEDSHPVRIVAIDIPIRALIALTFKLFIASLPLGVALGLIWVILTARRF